MKSISFTIIFFLLLVACVDDQGIVTPQDSGNLAPLARFNGSAVNAGDTAISAERLLRFENPAVALMWQFLGVSKYINTVHEVTVHTQAPYRFSGELLNLPPFEVYNSNEVALGTFVLFSDVNRNGTLDRVIHPELQEAYADIDQLNVEYEACLRKLLQISTVTENPIDYSDKFLITDDYSILLVKNGSADTVWRSDSLSKHHYRSLLSVRCRILRQNSKWDHFFANRKRERVDYHTDYENSDYLLETEYAYKRKLFPVTGKESEFEKHLSETIRALYALGTKSEATLMQAYGRKWIDYPFDGFYEQGQDWVAGRSTWFHVLYLPDYKSINELLKAERRSSFAIEGKEKLHPGYNLISSDSQYRCKVLSWSEPITVELGENELYFNQPTELDEPVKSFLPAPVSADIQMQIEGVYDYRPFKPAVIVYVDSSLWLDMADMRTTRLIPSEEGLYFSPTRDIQVEVISFRDSTLEKIFLYFNGERHVLVPAQNDGAEIQKTKQRICELLSVAVSTETDSLHHALENRYVNDGDTLTVAVSADSIVVALPDMYPSRMYPSETWVLVSFDNDLQLQFVTDDQDAVKGVDVIRNGTRRYFEKTEKETVQVNE